MSAELFKVRLVDLEPRRLASLRSIVEHAHGELAHTYACQRVAFDVHNS